MPQIVNTNMAALSGQNQLNKAQKSQMQAMERLSSSLRINSAKDDAAGSAIVSRLSAQISGVDQAKRNTVDATNLSKVAEGGLNQMNDILTRVRQLAVQSSSDTYTTEQRQKVASEAKTLLEGLNQKSAQINFNGKTLFDGSFKGQFQVGANVGETVSMSIGRLDTKTLGSSATAAVNSIGKSGPAAMTSNDLVINGVAIGASSAAYDTASSVDKDKSAISKAAAINAKSAQTGVTAKVNANEVGGSAMTAAVDDGAITLNGVSINVATTADAATSRQAVVAAINAKSAETGVIAEDTGLDTGGVKLSAADGRNITVAYGGTLDGAKTGLAAAATYGGTFTLQSDKAIAITGGAAGTLANAGLTSGTYQTQMATASGIARTTDATTVAGTIDATLKIVAGDFAINGTLVGSSLASTDTASYNAKESSSLARAAAINAISSKTGVTATANATEVAGASMGATADTTGSLFINGVQTGAINTLAANSKAQNRAAVVAEVNKISGQTGVIAIDTNDDTKGVQLVAADGRNITVTQATAGTLTSSATGLNASLVTAQAGAGATAAEMNNGTFVGSITLSSATAFTVTKGNNSAAKLEDSIGMGVGTYGEGRNGMSLEMIDLTTREGAEAALKALDNAMSTISDVRAGQGAFQNRMASTLEGLDDTKLNLTDTRSGIQDADFAAESAELSRSQVLLQAGVAMLAQANQSSQNVLSLLR